VRQALSHAIDKQQIIKGVLLGLGVPAEGPYKPGLWFHNPDVRPYAFDPAKARALLAEAGWTDHDGDGLLDKDGRPFRFELITNQGNDQRAKAATIIQARLAEIGIGVSIRIIEWAAFLNQFIDPGNFDATILGWTTGFEPDLYDIFHSSKTGPKQLNFVAYKNPEVDDLLERGRRTFDQEERKKIYFRLQDILAEDQPYTFLYFPQALQLIDARFFGIEPSPIGLDYNFERWYVPKPLQLY
jgi:peptide/nickel transport system substrate-binding protein